MPRVSVIIPSFNHAKFVGQAIQSVLDQTYQNFEIVITDDGSSDSTVSEIKKFSDSRIRLFVLEKNQGAAVAANNCVQEATGEYIAMLSSDDMFLRDKLEKQVKFLDEHPVIAAVFGYAQIIDEDGNDFTDQNHFYYSIFKQPNRTRFEWLNHFFYRGNCLCHPSVLIRRECYDTIGQYDPRYAQVADFDFWMRLCMKYDIHIIPEELIKFRVRANEANASGDRPEVHRTYNFELSHSLKNYVDIETTEDLLKIFPTAVKFGEKIEEDLIPFFIAMLALETENATLVHQYFAANVLFDLLEDKVTADRFEKICGLKYVDFIKLTGKYDLLSRDTAALKYQLVKRDRQIHDIYNSYSWKITAPLRNAVKFFRKVMPFK